MTDRVFTQDTLDQIDDRLWKRVGVSQTFDRLLVLEVARTPASPADVQARISASLGAGAARFLALTFDKLVKDLCRRRILELEGEGLCLDEAFARRVRETLEAEERGDSRVDPTPGVTLADIQKLAKERDKRTKATTPSRSSRPSTRSRSGEAPRTRKAKSSTTTATPSTPRKAPVAAAPTPATAKELFTSRTVNKLLDTLDSAMLFKDQLRTKLSLRAVDLDRFLDVAGALELTRVTRDDMVELHWRGRELSRTSAAERRMVLIDLVKQLRSKAEEVA